MSKKRKRQRSQAKSDAAALPAERARPSAKQSRLQRRDAQRQAARRRQFIWVGGAVMIVIALAVISIVRGANAPSVDDLSDINPANQIGPDNAPVHFVEYGDFGCPSCRQWHLSGIKDRLVAEFGDQIQFTFRHYPVITPQSPKAAEAGQCAAEQNAFWAYHDYIYESAPQNALSTSQLKTYAGAIGLDQAQFDSCLDSGQTSSYVAADRQSAGLAGARGTPSFFINGEAAPFDYQSIAAVIRDILG